jgi:nucleotide-binding universal stress UspA family protein
VNPTEIRVGVDGSPASDAALHWAAMEAASRQADLVVVHAYEWRGFGTWPASPADASRERAEALVAAAVGQVQRFAPGVRVRGQAVLGSPGPVLIEGSATAELTVLGGRGRGGFASLLLGSVSQQVATHASGSVVVVRGQPDVEAGTIVVGVDGSPGGEPALAAAFEEAEIRHAGILAVRVYRREYPPIGPDMSPYPEDPVTRRDNEILFLEEDIAPFVKEHPDVSVRTAVIEGHTGAVLADVSASAQLVVVGTRGHGGFAGLLLGSVGLQLLHHAACPVLIAR